MSRGVYPSQVKCSYCTRFVYDTDATYYEGLPYHDSCMKFYFANQLKQFSKKAKLGTITFAEANLMKEIQENYDIVKKSSASIPVSLLINSEKPRFQGNSPLAIDTVHRKALEGKERKILKSQPVNQTLISDGKTEENDPKNNHPKNSQFTPTIDRNAVPS